MELREHMETAHRAGRSEQGSSQRDGTRQDSSKIQPREEQKTSES
jgi:hypothetical protein